MKPNQWSGMLKVDHRNNVGKILIKITKKTLGHSEKIGRNRINRK